MDASMYRYFKPGLIHFMAYPKCMSGMDESIVETVRAIARDDYFTAIELSWIKDDAARAQVKKIVTDAGLTVRYGAQPRLLTTGLNINDVDEAGRLKALETLKAGIDEAYELGAKGFAFLSGKYTEENKDAAYDALVRSTRELCAYAAQKDGMRVALEVFDYDVDKCSLIGPADLAAKFAAEIRETCPNFGLMVDLSHLPLLHESAKESLLPVKDYIIHAHLGNAVDPKLDRAAPGYGDQHPRFGFPGGCNGVPEMVEFLRVLLDIGFLNTENPPVVSFEVKPFGDEEPELVIANAKRTLNEAWAAL